MNTPFPTPPEPFVPPSAKRRGRDRALSERRPATLPEFIPHAASPLGPLWWLVLAAGIAIAFAVLVPAAAGVYVGLRERADYLHQQAVEHYQRALAYESENYTELALAELALALKFDSTYQPAQIKLETLQGGNNPSATRVPNDTAIAEQLFKRAQDSAAQKDWGSAIDSLEELRRARAEYRASEVKALLVQAYVNAAKQSVAAGQIEQARVRAEAALILEPAHADAKVLRDRATLYLNGARALDFDWQNAALSFQRLYELDPNFYDVKKQLLNALVNYGDLAAKQGAHCLASREYEKAVNLGADGAVASKLSAASASCKQAVTAPTATPTLASAIGFFNAAGRRDPTTACKGTGSVRGTVRDAQGNPLAGIAIQIYNDSGYRPAPVLSQPDGTYAIVLGKDPGLFHLALQNPDGTPASAVLDVKYPGGNTSGCHGIVDWTRTE